MPTPAQNLSQSGYFLLSATDYDGTPKSYSNPTVVNKQIRPASVNHPRRADNTRPIGPWSHTWYHANPGTGSVSYRYGNSNQTMSVRGAVIQYPPSGLPDPASFRGFIRNMEQNCLAQATEKQMQFSAAMAQARSTLKMVGSAATSLAHGIDSIMSGPKGLARTVGNMSNWRKMPERYLEYLYGWRTAPGDVANGLDLLNDYKARGYAYSMVLEHAQRDYQTLTQVGSCKTAGNGDWGNSVNWIGNRTIAGRCAFRFDLPQWYIDQTPSVVTPFSTGWELRPYSFVLDWFLPIGNWLGALESAQFAPFFKEGWNVLYVQDLWSILSFNTEVRPNTWWITQGNSTARSTCGTTARSVYNSYPWGSVLPPPALKPFPGLQQAAQGLALLTQAFKRWR